VRRARRAGRRRAILPTAAILLLTAGEASGWSDVVAAATPAIVRIQARTTPLHPALHALLLEHGLPAPERLGLVPAGSTGTGTRVGPGQVLTSAHVLSGTDRAELRGADGTTRPARVGWLDADLDLALLVHDPQPEDGVLRLADGPSPHGAEVLTLGHPLDGPVLASGGVLSGLTERGLLGRSRRTYLVTDAVIRPGHSGGPLLDRAGRCVGLLVGGFGPTSGAEGFGLALPAAAVQDALDRHATELNRRGPAGAHEAALGLAQDGDALVVRTVSAAAHALGLNQDDRLVGRGPAASVQALQDALQRGPVVVEVVDRGSAILPPARRSTAPVGP
jgi:S1-C subfamily serine protease